MRREKERWEDQLRSLEREAALLTLRPRNHEQSINAGWTLICVFIIFFMQLGFGFLEAGSVSRKSSAVAIIMQVPLPLSAVSSPYSPPKRSFPLIPLTVCRMAS